MNEEVYKYLESKYPEEACGVITKDRKFHPITNIADDPLNTFQLCPKEYIRIAAKQDILFVVHSHIDQEVTEFSELDKKISEFLKVPYMVVGVPSGEIVT